MIRLPHRGWRLTCGSQLISMLALGISASMIATATAPAACADGASATASKALEFNRDVRPILADKCWKCHGPDAKERKGKLRLDNDKDARAPAASGSAAIVPGKPEESELYQRIIAEDADERMPPAKTGKSLSAAEIAALKTWIEQGARYQGHWAFLPPRRPLLPPVKNPAWCSNPIDFFILARLEAEGLTSMRNCSAKDSTIGSNDRRSCSSKGLAGFCRP